MAPRPIIGGIGSRIRVVLGKDGNSWLLLLENDDGNQKWQSKDWHSIPSGLAKKISRCQGIGREVKSVDFGPDNSWYVHRAKPDGTGSHHSWGGLDAVRSSCIRELTSRSAPCKVALGSRNSVSSMCIISGNSGPGYECINTSSRMLDRLKHVHLRTESVHMIRLFTDGQYIIKDDQGVQPVLSNTTNCTRLKQALKSMEVEDVAMAGDGSWIVVGRDYFLVSTGVDKRLSCQIADFYNKQRERNGKREMEILVYRAKEQAERERQEAAEHASREEQQRLVEEQRKRREEEDSRAKKAAEEKLVENLSQEKESIDKLETKLEEMQGQLEVLQVDVCSRRRSLRESLEALPIAQRPRWDFGEDKPMSNREVKPHCVICQDKAPLQAVAPCGHLCLCDDCAPSILKATSRNRVCPLCRGPATCILRIFS